MGSGLYSHTTRAVGLTLTANIYNADHVNHITNHNTTQIDDYSANAAQMQTVTDPYPGAVESLATSVAGEFERMRYVIKQMSGKAHWYMDPSLVTVDYRSGFNCKFATATTITVEGGSVDVAGTLVTKTADTTLTLTTATDWVDDTSDQAVSKRIYIYINATGKIELNDIAPDESDTAGNTTGLLIYNDTGIDTSDRRCIGFAYLNATGSGELTDGQVWNWQKFDPGLSAQVVNTQTGTMTTGPTAIPHDNTVPQNTEGDQYMSLAITPKNSNNKLKIEVVFHAGLNAGDYISVALFQDSTAGALAAHSEHTGGANQTVSMSFVHYMAAGTTASTTFKVRAGGGSGILTFNGVASGQIFGGVMASSITITEIWV